MSSLKMDVKSKSTLNTTIDSETLTAFKKYCKDSGMNMGDFLEPFMKQLVAGEFSLKLVKSDKAMEKKVTLDEE